jgi:poly-gamma-glutamate capsule biosynthesis protein CapA/YwtB (metallophosphatase superfamily)
MPMNLANLILWESAGRQPIAARVAICGDFLPAGKLTLGCGEGWTSKAHGLHEYFADVVTTFVNLEATLDCDALAPRVLNGLGQIVAAPAESLGYMETIHARAVGIANNHSYDFGDAGVRRTRAAAERAGMTPLGAGFSMRERQEAFVWQGPGGVRVGFWAAAKAAIDLASENSRGVEPATAARGRQALQEMQRHGAQFCVALVHAGCLRTNRPDPEDVGSLDALAKSGFDIVAASHSHRVSGYRTVAATRERPNFSFYGLGSLVSGYVSCDAEREGLIVVAGLNASGALVRLEVRPVWLDESGFGSVPGAAAKQEILERFRALSAEIDDGSYERLFYHDVSQGLTRLYLRDARAAFRAAGIRGLASKARRMRVRHVKRLVHEVIG